MRNKFLFWNGLIDIFNVFVYPKLHIRWVIISSEQGASSHQYLSKF